MGLSIIISSTQSRGLHHLYPGGSGAAIVDFHFFFVIVINHDLVCVILGVCHLCSFTSSYASIVNLHDNPKGGFQFKANPDLDNLELG